MKGSIQIIYEYYICLATHLYYRYRYFVVQRNYQADVDPCRVFSIDPDSVEYLVAGPDFPQRFPICNVLEGDWERPDNLLEITNYRKFNSMHRHFSEGLPWEQTEEFQSIKRRIENGQRVWQCESMEDAKKRFEQLDSLYSHIKENGYKRQEEIQQREKLQFRNSEFYRCLPPMLNEITVNIDRNGNYILYDGRHRLLIAQILRLDSVPVRVNVRHKKWQQLRETAVSDGKSVPKQYVVHPDVSYLLD